MPNRWLTPEQHDALDRDIKWGSWGSDMHTTLARLTEIVETELKAGAVRAKDVEEPKFFYIDDRRESEHQSWKSTRYDDNPELSAKLQEDRIAKVRLNRDTVFELTKDTVDRYACFSQQAPAALPHIFFMRAHCSGDLYTIVSNAWRDEIEAIEPSVHTYIPYELRYSDKVFQNYYIINAPKVDAVNYAASEFNRYYHKPTNSLHWRSPQRNWRLIAEVPVTVNQILADLDPNLFGGEPPSVAQIHQLFCGYYSIHTNCYTLNSGAIQSRHYFAVSFEPERTRMVSKLLMQRLARLTPSHVHFVPVKVV